MKLHFTYLVLTAGLSAILGSATLSAQATTEIANVPFTFHANNTTLPAGTYTLNEASNAAGVFHVRDESGRGIFVTTAGRDESKMIDPKLTFTCYGDECVLSEISMPDGMKYRVSESAREKELTRKLGVAANLRSVVLAHR